MFFERLAVLVGGLAAGALLRRWQELDAARPPRPANRLTHELSAEVRAHEHRLSRLEARADAHDVKLNEIPSTALILASMDELLKNALRGLEGRLTAQAQSIETLQMAVSQTDELLERVLESIDALRDQPPAP